MPIDTKSTTATLKKPHNEPEDDYPFDLDKLINLEEQYYEDGYKEGQLEGIRKQFQEGKELGIQTGFQRFIIIGQLRVLVKLSQKQVNQWLSEGQTHTVVGKRDLKKLQLQFERVGELIETLFDCCGCESMALEKGEDDKKKEAETDTEAGCCSKNENGECSCGVGGQLKVSNSDEEVEKYEKIVKLVRAKVRSLCGFVGLGELYRSMEKDGAAVGLVVPVAPLTGADTDMW
ncbi:unnamed protein product [Ambrosiozyma monospora]|uniref:Unnamed protein product n=1 Tax=Ambrosiozyma monospora TaxID=43982 RepID=A0ACB5SVH0_AMBMO|nr:unnamed protein product [Ambrosiozyma monospora]